MSDFVCAGCGGPDIHIDGECATLLEMDDEPISRPKLRLKVEILDGETLQWEWMIDYLNPWLFRLSEYREAVFAQAERHLGRKLETELAGRFPVTPVEESFPE